MNRKRINEDVRDSERFSEEYHDARDTFSEEYHDALKLNLTQHLNTIKIKIKEFMCEKWCKTIMFSKCERCKDEFFGKLLKQIIDRIKRRSILEISSSYARALTTACTDSDTIVASHQTKYNLKNDIEKYITQYNSYHTDKLLKKCILTFLDDLEIHINENSIHAYALLLIFYYFLHNMSDKNIFYKSFIGRGGSRKLRKNKSRKTRTKK